MRWIATTRSSARMLCVTSLTLTCRRDPLAVWQQQWTSLCSALVCYPIRRLVSVPVAADYPGHVQPASSVVSRWQLKQQPRLGDHDGNQVQPGQPRKVSLCVDEARASWAEHWGQAFPWTPRRCHTSRRLEPGCHRLMPGGRWKILRSSIPLKWIALRGRPRHWLFGSSRCTQQKSRQSLPVGNRQEDKSNVCVINLCSL